ncbi:amino acid permease [Salmonella enterica subsp. arizonae]|uniref:Amino acid permease n=1 Tax=Salmonella enterica subsp. arizonae TaxID=59203 RepID=A0A379TI46_SALER|nr:amino acid permease [Salmonella enterica subsp. arizonae]
MKWRNKRHFVASFFNYPLVATNIGLDILYYSGINPVLICLSLTFAKKKAAPIGERRLANVLERKGWFELTHTIKKMSLIGLILMIFTSVFGFANSPSAFYLMGYSAIPWYIFSALLFFYSIRLNDG